jgi:hypothetical protein
VQNERNKAVNMIQTSQQAAAEMKEKIGTRFTRFTGIKVQILMQRQALYILRNGFSFY